ncbi:MAG TPA: SprT family zinc-dependent metalloprotease [Ramlibacter sp.]|jgi:predicted metal-dependent hydrolase|uniref:M48 family metallopeptidase n=1 Tax=Ramlibacter sp. TaxID=1917967 RepID=UPI002D49148D|nr:SprT family zinc-dependent metalloprotease [Ramlibacter sp.]HZY20639.1 SprT family zinc-dependent metalloprotease [Ramlibacter sp.]
MSKLLQLTLDLFGDPAPTLPSAPAPDPVRAVPDPGPTRPAEPLEAVLAPATFHHPRANRRAVLGHTFVAYEFKRGKRRSIGFVVGPEGLTVSAPKWVPLAEVDAAVQSKSSWILAKLDAARERRERVESARIAWQDGAAIPFLGEQVIVVLDSRRQWAEGGASLNTDGQALPGVPRLTLHVGLPQHATGEQIRDAVQAWLMRQAKRLFTERLDHFAPQLGVQWKKLVLSNAGTRWGTAHADGTIRLNWRLVHFRLPVIDYVVAHELSHLRVMDHSPRFWDTVATVVPDYAALRGQLREEALPPW